jgi:hypothetical protein
MRTIVLKDMYKFNAYRSRMLLERFNGPETHTKTIRLEIFTEKDKGEFLVVEAINPHANAYDSYYIEIRTGEILFIV